MHIPVHEIMRMGQHVSKSETGWGKFAANRSADEVGGNAGLEVLLVRNDKSNMYASCWFQNRRTVGLKWRMKHR